MAKLGPKNLILACRNKGRCLDAEKKIKAFVNDPKETNVEFMQMDLADLKSVEAFAK